MVLLFLIGACLCMVCHSFTESTPEIMYDKPEWKFAMRKMEEIQNIIQIQNERISTLELQSEELCKLTVKDLQKIIKQQNDRIARLETRVEDLYKLLTTAEHEPGLAREAIDASREENAMTRRSKIRKALLPRIQPIAMQVKKVAFFAFSTSMIHAPAYNHTLVFDNAVTNIGNAYNTQSGKFIAPNYGLYVFTWTIRIWGPSYHTTELLVDNSVVHAVFLNPGNVIDGTVTGTAVVYVAKDSEVLVRTGSRFNKGDIISDSDGRSSFAGWNIM